MILKIAAKSYFTKKIYLLGTFLSFACSLAEGFTNSNSEPIPSHSAGLSFHTKRDVGLPQDLDTEWDNEYGTLIFANVIYRHGDRTPVEPYPLDPYKNLSYWPVGWGQLTNHGKEQHFELGQWLRKRYGKLLGSTYSNQDIFVRSTDVDRTLMSAESNLAGLYPPEPPQVWNPSVKWQPIPVHTVPEHLDELLAAKKHCPRYDTALSEAKSSKQMQEVNRKYAELYQYLTVHTGENVSDVTQVEYIYNTLYIENLYNLTLPEWTKDVFPDKMAVPAAFSFTVATFTKEMRRLKSGPLLGDITRHMQQKIAKELNPDRKMFMYSGHDTTLANLLMTLGVFDVQSPPYAGTILLDLWQKNQKYFVTIMFRNTSGQPYLLKMPGCAQVCPFEDFLDVTRPLIPTNWEQECVGKYSGYMDIGLGEYSTVLVGLILFGVLIIMMSVCFVMTLINFRQNKSQFRYQRLPENSRSYMFEPL